MDCHAIASPSPIDWTPSSNDRSAFTATANTPIEELPFELLQHVYSYIGLPLRCIHHSTYDRVIIMTKTTSGHDRILIVDHEDLARSLSLSKLLHDRIGSLMHRKVPLHLKVDMVVKRSVDCKEVKVDHSSLADGIETIGTIHSHGIFLDIDCDATSFSLDPIEAEMDLSSSLDEPSQFDWIDTTDCNNIVEGEDWADEFEDYESLDSAFTLDTFTASDTSTTVTEQNAQQWMPSWDNDGNRQESKGPCSSNEEDINRHIVSSFDFEDLRQRLMLCHHTQDIAIIVNTRIDEHGDQEQELHTGRTNIFHDALIQIVEQMPRLRRHAVRVNRFTAFGSRQRGQAWTDTGVQRVSHQGAYEDGYGTLLDGLHVRYEPTGRSGNCVCGCVGAQKTDEEREDAGGPVAFDFW
ncbi:hypothetical protein CKM354_000699500 [Cercospora kikuchii]|uniref:Uncharacterized protein n=1 Tax=Cercospora kikuchii TaxID=84275 RepID=A0A9P3CJA7_9PEZI|nr:uncharacterized protein CKM354_000699500 [Cercospora kikuchii]GIZ43781.1 hypothetical protein CKM354_000699500 [Cercospora kikuchii]